jgi:uncharacterized protein (DUF427 family)
MKAYWNNTLLAESDETIVIEGNHYFPPHAVKMEYFTESSKSSACPWKGVASYFNINAEGQINQDAAWYYPSPKDAAAQIKNYIAFWKGVEVREN